MTPLKANTLIIPLDSEKDFLNHYSPQILSTFHKKNWNLYHLDQDPNVSQERIIKNGPISQLEIDLDILVLPNVSDPTDVSAVQKAISLQANFDDYLNVDGPHIVVPEGYMSMRYFKINKRRQFEIGTTKPFISVASRLLDSLNTLPAFPNYDAG